MSALVTVLSKFANSWPKHRVPLERADTALAVGPLGDALAREWDWDAHFVSWVATPETWVVTGAPRRLGRAALDRGVVVELAHAVFECDDPVAHQLKIPARAEWRDQWRRAIARLLSEHPGAFVYETKGGGRFVYELPAPTVLRGDIDGQKWRRDYVIAVAYFARRFGVVADKSCADWTRYFRLPRVTRDGSRQDWPTWGDPQAIRQLHLRAEQCDVDAARSLVPTAFRAPQLARAFRGHTRASTTGRGILYHLLRARGLIADEFEDGSCAVTCPNAAEHSVGTDATRLYPPRPGEEVGAIHCYHDHCTGFTAAKWLSFFTDEEKESARSAAGVFRLDLTGILAKRRAP
ncbi:MAG: hypothetical protein IPM35_02460 [Myxococcales bacterium]|nr:hypothetical protein [Myxococcales bacterium]